MPLIVYNFEISKILCGDIRVNLFLKVYCINLIVEKNIYFKLINLKLIWELTVLTLQQLHTIQILLKTIFTY